MGYVASPPGKELTIDRDQDLTHIITLPAGTYLSGGAAAWSLSYEVTHPTTDVALFSKTQASGIAVTTAGSTTADAVFTVTILDTDIASALKSFKYNWRFKRTDAGSEINIDGGTIQFKR